MKVTMCLVGGIPRADDASTRNLRALRWLSKHHTVSLLPIYLSASHNLSREQVRQQLSDVGVPVDSVTMLPALQAPGYPSLRKKRTANSLARGLKGALFEQIDDTEWLWVSFPPLVADGDLIKQCRNQGIRISWDWDCLSLLAARSTIQEFPSPAAALSFLQLFSQLTYEFRYLRHLHALTVPGPTDKATLERTTRRRVLRLRAAIDVSRFSNLPPVSAEGNPTALFIGSHWPPNIHGISWVLRNVWPGVEARLPDARLRIVGRGMSQDLLPDVGAGVEIVGEVPDVRAELGPANVVLSPIFFGAGIPTKLLEAAASGKATLVTTYCARVLGTSPFDATDDARMWTRHLIDLLENPTQAEALGAHNLRFAHDHWDESGWVHDMEMLDSLMSS